MKNGKCPAGEYYCYTDKKCKPIPKGFKVVGAAGMLRKENGHSVDDDAENKNGNGNGNGGSNGGVSEGTLHKWFKGSKSKDGKGGWVNVVTGGTCASDEPGEGTPKCVSSAKRASMSKSERLSAARRKKRADPGQQSKSGAAKPTYVSTDKPKKKMDEAVMRDKQGNDRFDRYKRMVRHKQDKYGVSTLKQRVMHGGVDHNIDNEKKAKGMKEEVILEKDKKGKGSGTKDACYHKVKSRYSVWPSAYASGALVKCRKVGAANWGNSTKKEGFTPSQIAALEHIGAIELNEKGQKCWKGYEKKGTKKMFGKTYNNCVKKEEVDLDERIGLDSLGYGIGGVANAMAAKQMAKATVIGGALSGAGSVIGGALNYAASKNKKKAEDKKKVKKEEVDVQASDSSVSEAATLPRQNGQVMRIFLTFRGKFYMTQMFFPSLKVPSKAEITDAVQKVYPDARVTQYTMSTPDPTQPLIRVAEDVQRQQQKLQRKQLVIDKQKLQLRQRQLRTNQQDMASQTVAKESAAWQRKEGKNKEGGLNEKGRKSYERENPGSDLKAPQPEGGPRKKSFCARMKGMKKKLTSAKTANDPDSRINKSLRKWKC